MRMKLLNSLLIVTVFIVVSPVLFCIWLLSQPMQAVLALLGTNEQYMSVVGAAGHNLAAMLKYRFFK